VGSPKNLIFQNGSQAAGRLVEYPKHFIKLSACAAAAAVANDSSKYCTSTLVQVWDDVVGGVMCDG
jgi:hypothetical protein